MKFGYSSTYSFSLLKMMSGSVVMLTSHTPEPCGIPGTQWVDCCVDTKVGLGGLDKRFQCCPSLESKQVFSGVQSVTSSPYWSASQWPLRQSVLQVDWRFMLSSSYRTDGGPNTRLSCPLPVARMTTDKRCRNPRTAR